MYQLLTSALSNIRPDSSDVSQMKKHYSASVSDFDVEAKMSVKPDTQAFSGFTWLDRCISDLNTALTKPILMLWWYDNQNFSFSIVEFEHVLAHPALDVSGRVCYLQECIVVRDGIRERERCIVI